MTSVSEELWRVRTLALRTDVRTALEREGPLREVLDACAALEHSEQHWYYLDTQHIAKPSRAELFTFKTLNQWLAAGERYSDGKNAERRARGEPEIHALYAAVGHEVRPWFAQAGTAGLLKLIAELNTGAEFAAVYGRKMHSRLTLACEEPFETTVPGILHCPN